MEKAGLEGEGRIFKNPNEALMAYERREITLHTRIVVPVDSFRHKLGAPLNIKICNSNFPSNDQTNKEIEVSISKLEAFSLVLESTVNNECTESSETNEVNYIYF